MDRTERGIATWVTLLQAHATVVDEVEATLERECGLPLAWHEVLIRLANAPDQRVRMLDLAQSALLSKSGVTRLIDRMEGAGLVTREPGEGDRRIVWARLTGKGADAIQAAGPVFVRAVGEHFSRYLSEEELASVQTSLRKVLGAEGRSDEAQCSAHLSRGTCGVSAEAMELAVTAAAPARV